MTGKHGPVVLFVKGLPKATTRTDLKSLFKGIAKPGWRSSIPGHGCIGSCDILRITDRDSGDVEYHGVVEVQPANLGLKVMRELDGFLFQGHRLEVRRYRQRSNLFSAATDSGADAGHDRRRNHLSVELVQETKAPIIPGLSRFFSQESPMGSVGH